MDGAAESAGHSSSNTNPLQSPHQNIHESPGSVVIGLERDDKFLNLKADLS
jgi:hypothetical protein